METDAPVELENLIVGANRRDLAIANCKRLSGRIVRIHREDAAVKQDQLRWQCRLGGAGQGQHACQQKTFARQMPASSDPAWHKLRPPFVNFRLEIHS